MKSVLLHPEVCDFWASAQAVSSACLSVVTAPAGTAAALASHSSSRRLLMLCETGLVLFESLGEVVAPLTGPSGSGVGDLR